MTENKFDPESIATAIIIIKNFVDCGGNITFNEWENLPPCDKEFLKVAEQQRINDLLFMCVNILKAFRDDMQKNTQVHLNAIEDALLNKEKKGDPEKGSVEEQQAILERQMQRYSD